MLISITWWLLKFGFVFQQVEYTLTTYESGNSGSVLVEQDLDRKPKRQDPFTAAQWETYTDAYRDSIKQLQSAQWASIIARSKKFYSASSRGKISESSSAPRRNKRRMLVELSVQREANPDKHGLAADGDADGEEVEPEA